MPKASYASLILARFDPMRPAGEINASVLPDALFLKVGADTRAAAQPAQTQTAFKFAIFGLHSTLEHANQALERRNEIAPWLEGAMEVWGASLAPFRHFGEANFVNPQNPGSQFEAMVPEPPAGTPIVIVTSAGWEQGENLDMARIQDFSEGVTGVRVSMTAVPGLHSQQTFNFPGGLVTDGITVTIWKDFVSARDFAYGPGLHKHQMKRQREENLGDRTSFTRFKVVNSFGLWHGGDPLAWK
ncbi:MAG: hypothetical protein JSS72_11150 [Armatimonadetes bacterium]|nr:hypothetical protein [Armatimonadota bacterium]